MFQSVSEKLSSWQCWCWVRMGIVYIYNKCVALPYYCVNCRRISKGSTTGIDYKYGRGDKELSE